MGGSRVLGKFLGLTPFGFIQPEFTEKCKVSSRFSTKL